MKTDNEKIKELIKLSEENPELPIMVATFYEVIGDDWGYWRGNIEKIEKGYFSDIGEEWRVGDKEEIYEEISDRFFSDSEYDSMPKEEYDILLESKFDELLENKLIVESIVVYVGLP